MNILLYIGCIYISVTTFLYLVIVAEEVWKFRNVKYTKFPVNKLRSHKVYISVCVCWFPLTCLAIYNTYFGSFNENSFWNKDRRRF